jgi:hypothetical protein
MRLREAAPAAGVFVVALAWLLLLRPYGFQLEDEGTLLSWFDRVARGQRSYVDFHTGYTPGLFAFGSAVFDTFGTSAGAMRGVLAVMNALSAAALTEVTRRVAGAWLAPIPALVWLAFVPLFVGEFSAFNIPYPTWPATFAWFVLALAMLAWARVPRASFLVIAGLAAAAAMWVRPNAGAFALAGATWVVAAFSARTKVVDLAAATAAAAVMALGFWYTFELRVWGMDAFVHLLPAFAVAISYGAALGGKLLVAPAPTGPGMPPISSAPGAAGSLAVLAAAFLVPTIAWMGPLFAELGRDRFLYEVFLIGAGYQSLYYIPHPPPEPFAVLVVVALLIVAGAGRLIAAGRVKPMPLLVLFAAAGAAALVVLLRTMVAPEGLAHSVVLQLENASYWLTAAASFGALAWLSMVPAATLRKRERARALAVVVPLSIAMYAQMFPRSDFMHQVQAMPLAAVVACGLLDRVAAWWTRGAWPAGWNGAVLVRSAVVATAAAVLLLAFSEKATGPLEALGNRAPQDDVSARLPVHVEASAGDELEAAAKTVEFLRANTEDGEELWSFPATSGILFAAGRVNLAPHDYWYPGRPDHDEEARVLALLEQKRPRYIVTLGRSWNFFAGSPGYFESLRGFAGKEYTLAARFGRYDVLGRRDVVGDAAPVVSRTAPTTMADVLEPKLERRRQAAARWMESLTPGESVSAALPGNKRDTLLLLRALRDGGDMRGAAWAILGFESSDARVRREAVDAMQALAKTLADARARFANDFDAAALRPFVAPWAARAKPLRELPELRSFADGVMALSGEAVSDSRE